MQLMMIMGMNCFCRNQGTSLICDFILKYNVMLQVGTMFMFQRMLGLFGTLKPSS